MFQCVECGSKILTNNIQSVRIECECCGIELELVENTLIGLQLGPSEE
jgi:hypothetical protein